jgi:glutathione synthase/RimK-type ligase-like ATP-grasp enzyme
VQILVIALRSDLHADSVVYHLNKKDVDIIRIDPTVDKDIPQKMTITSGQIFKANFEFQNSKSINPLECNGVFCRFAIDSLTSSSEDPLKYFTASEALCAFLAPLRMIESSYWINDPWIENRSDCKLFQSKIAQVVGLKIPEFIVSSNYDDLYSFYKGYKNVIIKPLSDTTLASANKGFIKHENLDTNNFLAPYTARFTPLSKEDMVNLDGTPTLLQQEIVKKSDIRATVIDNKIFAVEMPYKEGDAIDFRLNKYDDIKEYNLPDSIKDKIIQLVKLLGLRFASCDLLLDKHDQIYFLESNVQGNWLWTETDTNLPISENIANALLRGKTNGV